MDLEHGILVIFPGIYIVKDPELSDNTSKLLISFTSQLEITLV